MRVVRAKRKAGLIIVALCMTASAMGIGTDPVEIVTGSKEVSYPAICVHNSLFLLVFMMNLL